MSHVMLTCSSQKMCFTRENIRFCCTSFTDWSEPQVCSEHWCSVTLVTSRAPTCSTGAVWDSNPLQTNSPDFSLSSCNIAHHMEVPADFGCTAILPGVEPVSIQFERPLVRTAVRPLVRQNTNHQTNNSVCEYFWDSWWVYCVCVWSGVFTTLDTIKACKAHLFFESPGNFMYFMGFSKWLLLSSRLVAGESVQISPGTNYYAHYYGCVCV